MHVSHQSYVNSFKLKLTIIIKLNPIHQQFQTYNTNSFNGTFFPCVKLKDQLLHYFTHAQFKHYEIHLYDIGFSKQIKSYLENYVINVMKVLTFRRTKMFLATHKKDEFIKM